MQTNFERENYVPKRVELARRGSVTNGVIQFTRYEQHLPWISQNQHLGEPCLPSVGALQMTSRSISQSYVMVVLPLQCSVDLT